MLVGEMLNCRGPTTIHGSLRQLSSLKYRRDPLPATDAHGHECIPLAGARKLIDRLDGIDSPRGADRMAERNPAAIRINLRRVEPELVRDRAGLRGEGFIRYNDIHVGDSRVAGIGPRPI